jgi:hypothetical protein
MIVFCDVGYYDSGDGARSAQDEMAAAASE